MSAVYDDGMLLFGGKGMAGNSTASFGSVLYYNDVWLLRRTGDKWAWECLHDGAGQAPVPQGRYASSIVVHGDRMIMYGGETKNSEPCPAPPEKRKEDAVLPIADVWEFDLIHRKWRQINSNSPPGPRLRHLTAVWKDRMYLYGGESGLPDRRYPNCYLGGESYTQLLNDVWYLDLHTWEWTKMDAVNPPVGVCTKGTRLELMERRDGDAYLVHVGDCKFDSRNRRSYEDWRKNMGDVRMLRIDQASTPALLPVLLQPTWRRLECEGMSQMNTAWGFRGVLATEGSIVLTGGKEMGEFGAHGSPPATDSTWRLDIDPRDEKCSTHHVPAVKLYDATTAPGHPIDSNMAPGMWAHAMAALSEGLVTWGGLGEVDPSTGLQEQIGDVWMLTSDDSSSHLNFLELAPSPHSRKELRVTPHVSPGIMNAGG